MNQTNRKLIQKRQALLERLAALQLLVQGSYLVVYEEKKQRQVYVPHAQREPIQEGIRQHEELRAIVKEITRINVRLMRERALAASEPKPHKGGKRHE